MSEIETETTAKTSQQALMTAGQRKVNMVWEYTQAMIAISVVAANLVVGVYSVLIQSKIVVPEMLSNALFLVVGFYFSRTNHAAIGGVGSKPTEEYQGR